jgi:DNA polymerase-3 subunit epsilon
MVECVLILDTETTDLDPDKGQVIELGAILYSVKHQTTLQQVSTLLPATSNLAERINRITPASLAAISIESTQMGIAMITQMAQMAEYIVAHNAEFDQKWFGRTNGEIVLPTLVNSQGEPLRWVCTCSDFEFPKQLRPRQSLVDLALAHGIGVYANHRALTDCQLIASLFDVVEDLQSIFAKAIRPKARYAALVSFEDRNLAKQAGFRWYPETKTWERTMACDDVGMLPFDVKLIAQ